MMQQHGGKIQGQIECAWRERTPVYKVKMTQRQSQNRCTMHTICLFAFGSGMQCMTRRQL